MLTQEGQDLNILDGLHTPAVFTWVVAHVNLSFC
jgi:hypothetical protein